MSTSGIRRSRGFRFRSYAPHWLRLHQGEPHRRRCVQPLPPIVEGLLDEPLLLAELFYRYTASLLRRDLRAPILVPCTQFSCHSRSCHGSTTRPGERRWKRGLSDVYVIVLGRCPYKRTKRLDLRCADLSGFDLTGINLDQADLRDAVLNCTILKGASLRGAVLTLTAMEGADLSEALLDNATMNLAILKTANLYKARVRGIQLRSSVLCGASCAQADLTGASLDEANLENCSFTHARLSKVSARGVNIRDAIFEQAIVDGSDFSEVELAEALQLTEAQKQLMRRRPEQGSSERQKA